MAGPTPEALSDMAISILDAAQACLTDGGLEVPDRVFVSHGQPSLDCCSTLAVWVRSIRAGVDPFPTQASRPVTCGDTTPIIEVSLWLSRDCFPVVQSSGNAPVFPTAEQEQSAADDLLVDAQTLWCCIQAVHAADELLPDPYKGIVWGVMTPTRGGSCAGWKWDFVVEGPGCCWDPPDLGSGGSGSGSG